MSHSIRATQLWIQVAAGLIASACGGTVTDLNGRNGGLATSGDPTDAGVVSSGGSPTGGGAGVAGSGWTDTGGKKQFGGAGGQGGYPGGGPSVGGDGVGGRIPQAGGACGYTFEPASWIDSCGPSAPCLDLDPSTWSPVASAGKGDAGSDGKSAIHAPFCQAPVAGQIYTFAFDAMVTERNYTAFDVATGSSECDGYHLAYLGYPNETVSPAGSWRTHCFSIDGRFLQSQLAVHRGDSIFSNLRVVSSCPCTRQIPYNVDACPSPQASAGAPNCM